MNTLDQIDLSEAEAAFAVANTPQFLLRKLRADSAVRQIYSQFKGNDVLKALKAAVHDKPNTLRDSVRPYIYLVALSYYLDVSYLRGAAKIVATHFDWFEHLANVLIKTPQTTSIRSFDVPVNLIEPPVSTDTTSSTSRLIIDTGK